MGCTANTFVCQPCVTTGNGRDIIMPLVLCLRFCCSTSSTLHPLPLHFMSPPLHTMPLPPSTQLPLPPPHYTPSPSTLCHFPPPHNYPFLLHTTSPPHHHPHPPYHNPPHYRIAVDPPGRNGLTRVMLTGMIADVLVARQRMVGCFPLVLMFDVGDDSEELDKIGRCVRVCVCKRVCACVCMRVCA